MDSAGVIKGDSSPSLGDAMDVAKTILPRPSETEHSMGVVYAIGLSIKSTMPRPGAQKWGRPRNPSPASPP